MNKNEEYVVDIIDNGFEGEGIAKIDGLTIFVPNTIKGEKVKIKILKVCSSHAYGKIIEIITKSEFRKESDCETYNRCGRGRPSRRSGKVRSNPSKRQYCIVFIHPYVLMILTYCEVFAAQNIEVQRFTKQR